MNEKALKTLEYTKIIDQLTEYASTEMGKQMCRELQPSCDLGTIRQSQTETTDALTRVRMKGSLSFGGVKDVRGSMKRLEIGSSLGIPELLAVSSLLTVAARAQSYGRHEKSEEFPDDSLDERFRALDPLTPVNNEIKRCLPSEDEVSDDASPGLAKVRRSMKIVGGRVHTQLNSILNSSRTYLQDAVITMRDGRYCLPVKAEYKSQVPGMVHDQSSTGSTVFIEPLAIVKLNNELRELEIQEKREIEFVLAALSSQLMPYTDAILSDLSILAELDFIFAKAALSRHYNCVEPKFNNKRYINIKDGRHPLLNPKQVVPINIWVGDSFDLLIVTGPNTGGKTVSLKTVGLFTLMGQAGLHIPAYDHSHLRVYEEVYADIGDEQSIEQSLSTFSSHMVNTVYILKRANKKTLALFDELGAGTDPTEGAALAIAILDNLHNRNVTAMATTHYSELKIYALSTDGVENASCEFDVESLQPTYRLLVGVPGKSNAFAISGKLGLPKEIIDEAGKLVDSDSRSFEDVVTGLEDARTAAEKEREKAKKIREEAEHFRDKMKAKNERIDAAKDKILRRANEEAHEIIQKAKDTADESIRKYNKWMKGSGMTKEMEKERANLRKALNETESELTIEGTKKAPKRAPDKLQIGDIVMVHSMGIKGTVSTLPNSKGKCFVQMGILRSEVSVSDLELLEQETKAAKKEASITHARNMKMAKAMTISPEINLIGKTVDEALGLLDKYLDDAYLAKLHQVTIIHGVGTGALRNAVQNHCKKSKYVKSYRMGEYGEGGYGVTVVEFK